MMFIGCFALSFIASYLYNSTNGSLLTCILFHNAINTSAVYFFGNVKSEELRPLLIWILLLIVAAAIIFYKTKGSLSENEQLNITNTAAKPSVATSVSEY